MMWHDGWGAGNWLVMSVMMLVVLALVVVGGLWLVRAARQGSISQPRDARQILDERFAHGEITENEYRQRRGLLASR